MKSQLVIGAIVAAFLVTATPALAKKPSIDTSDQSTMTIDGLYPVMHGRLDYAVAKPDFNLGQYNKVKVVQPTIAYRRNSYELSEKQAQKLIEYFNEALSERLVESGYTVVDSVGSDVLLIESNIIDLEINRPTEPSVGRTSIFTASSGTMTLIGELKDSMSGEILARFADKQQPRRYWAESTRVSEWSEARRAFRFWAKILGERLDAFHEEE